LAFYPNTNPKILWPCQNLFSIKEQKIKGFQILSHQQNCEFSTLEKFSRVKKEKEA